MSFSRSKGGTTSTSTVNESRNLNVQDVEGITVAETGGSVNILQTDQGAFDTAESIARESLAVGEEIGRTSAAVLRDVAEASFDFGGQAFDVADRATDRALTESFRFGERAFDVTAGAAERALGEGLDFGRSALEAVGAAGSRQADTFADTLQFADRASAREREAFSEALSFGDTSVERSTNFARSLFGDALEAVGAVVEQGQTQLGNTVTALNAIAREQSTSSDARVADIASNAIRYGLIGFGLLAAGMLALRFAR